MTTRSIWNSTLNNWVYLISAVGGRSKLILAIVGWPKAKLFAVDEQSKLILVVVQWLKEEFSTVGGQPKWISAFGGQLKLIPIGYCWAIEINTYSLLVCDQKRSSQSLTDDWNGSWLFIGGQNTQVLEGSHHMTMDLNFSEICSFIKEDRKNGFPKCQSFPNSFWVRNSFPQLKRVNGSEYSSSRHIYI